MFNRIMMGLIVVVLLSGGVFFADLSRKAGLALRESQGRAVSLEASLERDREEKARLKKDLEASQADLQEQKRIVAELRHAFSAYEGNIQKLRQRVEKLTASAEESEKKYAKKVKALEEGLTSDEEALRETRGILREKEQALTTARESNESLQNRNAALQEQLKKQKAALEEQKTALEKQKAALELERKKTERAIETVASREKEILMLQETIAGKSSNMEKVALKLGMTEASYLDLRKKHRQTLAQAREEAKRAADLKASLEALKRKFSTNELQLRETRDMLQIDIVNRILFDVGSAKIREKGRETLDKLVDFLKNNSDKMIRVEGHTDNQPISGRLSNKYPTNWDLSAARAISVVRYLQEKGVAPERLSATGYSFYKAAASNETEEGRARNRRIVILMSRLKEPR